MLILTTELLENYEIEEYLGYVSETVTLGILGLIEMFQIADTIGGESSIYKKEFSKAKNILNKRLEDKALEMGGNAIIGLRISYNEITGKNKSSLLISGTGTVVKMEMSEEHKEMLRIFSTKQEEEKIKEIEKYRDSKNIDELIKILENTTEYSKEAIKNIILESEDFKNYIKEFFDYDTELLKSIQEYNEKAKLTLLLR